MKKSIKTILATTILTIATASIAFAAPNAKVTVQTHAYKSPSVATSKSNLYKKDKTVEVTKVNNAWGQIGKDEWIPLSNLTFTDSTAKAKFTPQIKKSWKLLGSSEMKMADFTKDETSEVVNKIHNLEMSLFKGAKTISANGSYSFNKLVGVISEKAGFKQTKNKKFNGVSDAETLIRQAATGVKGLTFVVPEPNGMEIKSSLKSTVIFIPTMDYNKKIVRVDAYLQQ